MGVAPIKGATVYLPPVFEQLLDPVGEEVRKDPSACKLKYGDEKIPHRHSPPPRAISGWVAALDILAQREILSTKGLQKAQRCGRIFA